MSVINTDGRSTWLEEPEESEEINFNGWPAPFVDAYLERIRQNKKWGEQNHDPITWSAILTEEVGEFSQAALQTYFGGDKGGLKHLRDEAIHCAAVALQIIECLNRGKWTWPGKDKD